MLPKIIGYFFIKRFNIQIECGRVSFPFTLRAVKIIKNGFSIVCISTHLMMSLIYFDFIICIKINNSVFLVRFHSKSMKSRFEAVFSTPRLVSCCRLQYVTFVLIKTSMKHLLTIPMEDKLVMRISPTQT